MTALGASFFNEEVAEDSAGYHDNYTYYFTTSPKLRYETWIQACSIHVFTHSAEISKKKKD
jgi:hypothetical protein